MKLFAQYREGIIHQLLLAGLCLSGLATALAQDADLVPVQQRIMYLTPEQRQQMMLDYLAAPQVAAAPGALAGFASSLSLLAHVPYIPSERNQGGCGDCWQWAGTGVMEVAHDVQDGVFERLSVQFENSCQTQAACCNGGWLRYVADFYSRTRTFAIPWANTNGSFTSGNGNCSKTPCDTIATAPQFPITSISVVSIATLGVGRETAIANIKSVLNENKAIWFAFWLPEAGWSDFDRFWSSQPESTVWTNFYCGQDNSSAGHAVLCVGYNDDSPTNRYWLILNSWGASSRRPNGLFRVSMELDYDCVDAGGMKTLTWQTLDIAFTPVQPPSIDGQPQSQSAVLGAGASFTVSATGQTKPITYQWRKAGVPITGATNSSYTLSSVKFSDAGAYSVVVANPYAATNSSSATLTVLPPVALPVALDNTNLAWTTDNSTFWYGQAAVSHDGVDAAQSYPIGHGQQTRLSATVTGPGTLAFWWKVSSQTNADCLTFATVSNALTFSAQISGEANWQPRSFLLPAGTQTLQWTYTKDATLSTGQDAAWVDEVSYLPGAALPRILTQPAGLLATAAEPVTFAVSATGTPPLVYQWRLNGTPLPGATGTSLTIANPSVLNRGLYSVSIANSFGGLVSSNAALDFVPLVARGDNSLGQINFSQVATNAVGVAAGAWHSLILRGDGGLAAWGENYDGQCSLPANLKDLLAVAAGGYHSLALKLDGTVVAWGNNAYGQATVPVGLSNVTALAAGAWHSLALRATGTVVAWGDNSLGQSSVPAGLANVVAIAGGGNHSLALRANGTVAAWGENTDALGNFSGQSLVPWDLSNVVAIAAGDYHSLAVKADGTVVGWGDNSAGQAQAPAGLTNAIAVAGGGSHSVALKADTTIGTWGSDWGGLCDFPAAVSNVVALAAGNSHTVVLVGDSFAAPQLLHPLRGPGQFKLVLQTFFAKNYALEYKTSLAATTWTKVAEVRGNGMLQILSDPAATTQPRFYRVRRW